MFLRLLCLLLAAFLICGSVDETTDTPSVLLVLLARNKAHVLPYFLGYVERLDYPKEKISVWVRVDHSIDSSSDVLRDWAAQASSLYESVDFDASTGSPSYDNSSTQDWSAARHTHLMKLKQLALETARRRRMDFIWFVDVDNFLVNPSTLKRLIAQEKPIIAPMLDPPVRITYSNFWCGVDERGYYRRTDVYLPTLHRERKGCFEVPMVHSTFLIDLRVSTSKLLAFDPPHYEYNGDTDDLLVFAFSAQRAESKMFVLNDDVYGRMPLTSSEYESLEDEQEQMGAYVLNELSADGPIVTSQFIKTFLPPPTDFGLDKIYVINLEHRPDRRLRMEAALDQLNIKDAHYVDAVYGKTMTENDLKEYGISMLPGYADPINHRSLTWGEIGCFLSHFNIWAEVLSLGLKEVLVLEDDIYFEPNFRETVIDTLNEVDQLNLEWDLIYLGRKKLFHDKEDRVEGSKHLVKPVYSYWTLGYLLSKSGAKKLIAAKPLSKMMAVDEYLCLMFNEHPRDDWKEQFPVRNLNAFSISPLVIYPTHYTYDHGYFSDTETSDIHSKEKSSTSKEEL